MKNLDRWLSILVFISVVVLIIGLGWGNYNLAKQDIAGEGFTLQRVSIRSLVISGNSPYNNSNTLEIQKLVPIENSFVPGNPPKYSSPLFSGILVFPFALIGNDTLAHTVWSTAQLIVIFVIMLVSIKTTAWKPSWYIFLLFLLFTIFSYHVFFPWFDGGLSIWAALFLTCAFLAISTNRNELAGILLALSAIQASNGHPGMCIHPDLGWLAPKEIGDLVVLYHHNIFVRGCTITCPRLDNTIYPASF